jgi:hypothetical protein
MPRHVLTREERQRGFRTTVKKIQDKIADADDTDNNYAYLAWLMRKVRGVGQET